MGRFILAATLTAAAAGLISYCGNLLTGRPAAASAQAAGDSAGVLFSEGFDDAQLLERGWYDGAKFSISAAEPQGGAGCIEYIWKAGATTPASSSGIRHLFEATDTVYLRFSIRLSTDWGWSGRPYHPHLMHFLTTENEKFAGPAATHLTVYIEPWNGRLRLAAQDIENRDQPHGLTQGPLRGGYNAQLFDSQESLFNDDRWHCVEAMFQLNSLDLKADKPNADGRVRGWFDGRLVIDRSDVVLRSTDFPKMKFNQFLVTPYFGPGLLPHEQGLWIDELAVGTKRLGPAPVSGPPAGGPLRVLEENPRYFTAGGGRAVYLTGSHHWNSLQDTISVDQPRPAFDYPAYLRFLRERGHNFMRMWAWEVGESKIRYEPVPYARTDSGRFDLTRFNEAYFDRLRSRVAAARDGGIYVSVMLFQGWSIYSHGYGNPWPLHPFNRANNVNGIDADRDQDGEGKEAHSLDVPAVTRVQEAYIRKVIDTLGDLDNVLYEVSNETAIHSKDWQYHIVNYVKNYEATRPKRHPVGMTAFDSGREGSMAALLGGPADWISPQNDGASGDYQDDPPAADGRKVIVSDTDHLWGVGGDRNWVWKSFTRGHHPIYMDPLRKEDRYAASEAEMEGARRAMGQTRRYAERMNLAAMKPLPLLASTKYCLADPGREYLVYLPGGGSVQVDLSPATGGVAVEWFDPASGGAMAGEAVPGGARREFQAPFGGPAVLYLTTWYPKK